MSNSIISAINAQRYIPSMMENSITHPEYGVEVHYSESKMSAIGFSGKGKKADFHYRFSSVSQMEAYIQKWVTNVVANLASRAEEIRKRKEINSGISAADHFQVGDIVYNSWGWEQTNIDFYMVTKVMGKTIEVRELYPMQVEGSMYSHGMACMVVASDEFKPNGDVYQLRVKAGYRDSISLSVPKSYHYFSKWDGRPLYRSWYA